MGRSLLILGAGGHGKVVLDIAQATNRYTSIQFLDDNKCVGEKVLNHTVIGRMPDYELYRATYTDAIVAIGHNETRMIWTKKLKQAGYHIPVLRHPTCVVSQYASLKEGTVIMPQATINADAQIGTACIINTGAIIEHDCIIEDGVHIAYGAVVGGGAKIGKNVVVDIGTRVDRNVEIMDGETIK